MSTKRCRSVVTGSSDRCRVHDRARAEPRRLRNRSGLEIALRVLCPGACWRVRPSERAHDGGSHEGKCEFP